MATSALTAAPAVLLLYHAIGKQAPDGAARYAVTPARFAEQLRLLRDLQSARAITVMELRAWWSGAACTGRPVVLCFDDGGRSDFEQALPALAAADLRASFFISTALTGSAGYMTWREIAALRSAGMDVECHGHRHLALTGMTPPVLERELRTARHLLHERVGAHAQFLAAPYGAWNRRVREAALCAGFRALCTSQPGRARAGRIRLGRNALRRSTSVGQLQAWLLGRPGSYAARIGRDWLLWTPKHILLRLRPTWAGPEAARAASRSSF
ncbi:MAG: polysaccharide deacetylase family protein [Terriglobales bacterium]